MTEMLSLRRPRAPTLAYALARPTAPARGAVLLVHGYQDHSSRYLHVVERWVARGLAVARLDLRGHGRSDGPRGVITRFSDYLDDLDDVLAALDRTAAWSELGPPVLFAHSMGALVAMHHALRAPGRVRALALSSPYFALALAVPAYKVALGQVLSGVLPGFGLRGGITVDLQTSCPEMQAASRTDPWRFEQARARWFTEVRTAQGDLAARAAEVALPVFCLAAGHDRIADVEVTRAILARVPGAELVVLPDHEHEVLHEVARSVHVETFADRIERWFAAA